MDELLKMAKGVLGPDPGISLLLFVLCGLCMWAYWQEKQKNDEIADTRLDDARQDTKLVLEALNDATLAVKEFKESNSALQLTLEKLATAAKQGHDLGQSLINKIK